MLTQAITLKAASTPTTAPENSPDELLFQCSGSEIVPKKSLVQLPSRNTTTTTSNNTTSSNPIFVVSAIEGVIASLKSLAGELDRPVYGLQCTKDAPLESIAEFADFYVKQMRQVQRQGPYSLVGYSFGALVAFEMALQLESAGETVNLTLLDGSPEYVTLHCQTIGKKAGLELEADGVRKALAYFTRQLNSSIGFLKVGVWRCLLGCLFAGVARDYTIAIYVKRTRRGVYLQKTAE